MGPISILLVDDNPIFLRITTEFLEAHKDVLVIGTAENGEDALAQARAMQPQIILTDLAMPGLSGLETIPQLRSMLPNTNIIALTVMNTAGLRQAALSAGADLFISKSAMRTELIPAIRQLAGDDREGVAQLARQSLNNESATHLRVLVMEDNAHLGRLYCKTLNAAGYKVQLAGTIQAARDLLDQSRFDVLLCDIHIGSDRGTDLLREKAALLATSGTQVIMVSGQPQYRRICEELGADFFLEKPISMSALVTLLNRLTARQSFMS